MNATKQQIEDFAHANELEIELDINAYDNRRMKKYSLWTGKAKDGEEWEDNLFYNADMRSLCGLILEYPRVGRRW